MPRRSAAEALSCPTLDSTRSICILSYACSAWCRLSLSEGTGGSCDEALQLDGSTDSVFGPDTKTSRSRNQVTFAIDGLLKF